MQRRTRLGGVLALLLLCEAYNLSRSSRAALKHLFALIHFWPANSLNVHSFDSSCSLSPNSSFVEARMWRHLSSIVNPITQSTSHRSSATRSWCHLVAKGPERHGGTVGPFDSRSLAVFGSSLNGFHLSKTQHVTSVSTLLFIVTPQRSLENIHTGASSRCPDQSVEGVTVSTSPSSVTTDHKCKLACNAVVLC